MPFRLSAATLESLNSCGGLWRDRPRRSLNLTEDILSTYYKYTPSAVTNKSNVPWHKLLWILFLVLVCGTRVQFCPPLSVHVCTCASMHIRARARARTHPHTHTHTHTHSIYLSLPPLQTKLEGGYNHLTVWPPPASDNKASINQPGYIIYFTMGVSKNQVICTKTRATSTDNPWFPFVNVIQKLRKSVQICVLPFNPVVHGT
jgi:hypothetical protein